VLTRRPGEMPTCRGVNPSRVAQPSQGTPGPAGRRRHRIARFMPGGQFSVRKPHRCTIPPCRGQAGSLQVSGCRGHDVPDSHFTADGKRVAFSPWAGAQARSPPPPVLPRGPRAQQTERSKPSGGRALRTAIWGDHNPERTAGDDPADGTFRGRSASATSCRRRWPSFAAPRRRRGRRSSEVQVEAPDRVDGDQD
jgi:hypothetical protein